MICYTITNFGRHEDIQLHSAGFEMEKKYCNSPITKPGKNEQTNMLLPITFHSQELRVILEAKRIVKCTSISLVP